MTAAPRASRWSDFSIWLHAFGYFAAYAPYSALAKAVSEGLLPGIPTRVSGIAILPISVLASGTGMILFFLATGWWRQARQIKIGSLSLPFPTLWTFLSGCCTSAIVLTTTLAYTFEGVSIVFVMLLMRGGVLVLAPVVDKLSGRPVKWFSWVGLALSFGALLVAFAERGGFAITLACAVDVFVYLLSYFIRLRFMSRLAKSADKTANRRYFVEEQLVATPTAVVALAIMAMTAGGEVGAELRWGWIDVWRDPVVVYVLLIGVLSQGTGIFGGLILLDGRENSYCVPVNRASSILAGVVASFGLYLLLGQRAPRQGELIGAGLVVLAILFLTVPPLLLKKRQPTTVPQKPAAAT